MTQRKQEQADAHKAAVEQMKTTAYWFNFHIGIVGENSNQITRQDCDWCIEEAEKLVNCLKQLRATS